MRPNTVVPLQLAGSASSKLGYHPRPVSDCPDSPSGAHRYRIETPHDGLRELPGVCRHCGGEKAFTASCDVEDWNGPRDGRGRPAAYGGVA